MHLLQQYHFLMKYPEVVKRVTICMIAILCIASYTYGQRGYYTTDSSNVHGINVINNDNDNFYICEIKKGTKTFKYLPNEILGYGIINGPIYKSYNISTDKVIGNYFVKEVSSGKASIYYLRLEDGNEHYFVNTIENPDLSLIPKEEEELKLFFKEYLLDCPISSEKVQYLKYKEHSLKRFIEDYNLCTSKSFPKSNFAVFAGLTSVNFLNFGILSNQESKYGSYISPQLGVYYDQPLFTSNFSTIIELNASRLKIVDSYDYLGTSHDLIFDYFKFNVPLSLRYMIPGEKLSFFFQGGIQLNLLLRNKSALFEYNFIEDDIHIHYYPEIIADCMPGLHVSSGLVWNCFMKYSLFGEFRYSYTKDIFHSSNSLSINQLSICTGIIF